MAASLPRRDHGRSTPGKRARGTQRNERLPFAPPEDWYEASDAGTDDPHDFRTIVQPPGPGYRHVLTPQDIRKRLRQLPSHFLAPLEVVQLSRMTRKKERYACYGMQWGTTLYLYPMESSRVEYHPRPPKPNQRQEAEMYGGRWSQIEPGIWKLAWSERAIRDFYLNNILIHELGHLLDDRNTTYTDRERFAEWFALEYGYKARRKKARTARTRSRRRHRAC